MPRRSSPPVRALLAPARHAHRVHRSRGLLAALAAAAVVLVSSCSDGTDPDTDSGAEGSQRGASEEPSSTHHGGGADSEGFGSSMAPAIVSVEDVAELGEGPAVGDEWSAHLGLNVCGRFLDPPAASAAQVGGFSTDGSGTFTLEPTTETEAGANATVGDMAELAGIDISTGSMTLPPSTRPTEVVLDDGPMSVAGATLKTGQRCGTTQAAVQLWIYTEEAASTGEDVRVVVTDPQDVPISQDGMTFVIALTPASSLPTLPPSALLD